MQKSTDRSYSALQSGQVVERQTNSKFTLPGPLLELTNVAVWPCPFAGMAPPPTSQYHLLMGYFSIPLQLPGVSSIPMVTLAIVPVRNIGREV